MTFASQNGIEHLAQLDEIHISRWHKTLEIQLLYKLQWDATTEKQK